MFRQACLRIAPTQFFCNITSSFSSEPLKQNFLQNLKNIRGCNNAQKLCGVLLNAKNLIGDTNFASTSSWDSTLDNDIFINQIVKILHKDKPEYTLVDMICKVLSKRDFSREELSRDEIDKRNRLMSLLLDFKKLSTKTYRYDNSRKYLKEFINDVESLIHSSDKDSSYSNECERNQPGGFGLLQSVLRESAADQARYLLRTIHKIGQAHPNFSEDEKREIGTLMVETIEPVSRCKLMNNIYCVRLRSSWLIKRSSLQFYKDFYGKFPTVNGILLENFNMDEINDRILNLDHSIIGWCVEASGRIANNLDGIENYDCDSEPDDTDIDEDTFSKMPKSHTWWGLCVSLLKELKKTDPNTNRSWMSISK